MRVAPKAIATGVLLFMLVGYMSEATAMSPNFATAIQTHQCQPTEVKITASTSRPSYAAGMTVKVIATIRNVSSKVCTAAIGGTSPSMTITNAKGVVVWDNCYSNDQPGACALYLALRTLKPSARYSTTRTWNQHIGGKAASRGTYKLEVRFADLGIKKTTKFKLVK